MVGGRIPLREVKTVVAGWATTGRRCLLGPHLALLCRFVLGAIFVVAGWSKIGQPGELMRSVQGFDILPDFLVRSFAVTLPWVEILSGSLLLIGVLVPSAGALLAFLNVMFLVAIGLALARGSSVDCGCFGKPEPLGWGIFARDVGFLLLSIQVLASEQRFLRLDRLMVTLLRRPRP